MTFTVKVMKTFDELISKITLCDAEFDCQSVDFSFFMYEVNLSVVYRLLSSVFVK